MNARELYRVGQVLPHALRFRHVVVVHFAHFYLILNKHFPEQLGVLYLAEYFFLRIFELLESFAKCLYFICCLITLL